MDFDEYEYLEKTVEEDEKEAAGKKKDDVDKSQRSYRMRDGEEGGGDEGRRSSKRSRGDDSNGDRKEREKEKDRDRRRSGRDEDRERRRGRSRGEKESDRDKDTGSVESDREKGRSRDRDGDRDRDKEKEKDREKRDRERERERRDREKEKEREREVEEREKERSRRSSSRSRRHEERERERSRPREPDFEGRDGRRFKDKKDGGEPEADPERDQRTVFAYQMPLKANERDVYEFFSKAGKVRDVRLIMDRNSRRSKGVGYIEFYDAMSVPMAIALSGQLLLGQPVMVKPSEAEKNLVQSTASAGGSAGLGGPFGPVDRKLYVGNLHFNMTELQLRQIFEPFGTVELVQLPPHSGQLGVEDSMIRLTERNHNF